MMKIVTFKLLLVASLVCIVPSNPVFAQNDDSFEAEDWDEEMLEESPIDEPVPAPTPAKKAVTPAKKTSAEDLPDLDSFEDEKPAIKKEVKKEEKKQPKKDLPKIEPVIEEVQPTPAIVEQPPIIELPPLDSKPKAVFEAIKAPDQSIKSGTTIKRAGPPLLLIARPVYAPYSNESKTMYISATAEAYFHFKLGALPGISVVPFERISNNIQYFRDFSRRITSSAYKETAKKIGAAYVLYSEYEPQGKKIKFATELFSITENKKIGGSVEEIEISKFEDGLYNFVNEASGALIGTIPQPTQEFLAAPVFGNKGEALGSLIASVGDYSKKKAEAAVPQFEKSAKDNANHLAKFAAAEICAQAKQYEKAVTFIQQLEEAFGSKYPALLLKLAELQRLQSSYDAALASAGQASGDKNLKILAQIEKARIQEAQGNLRDAKRAYEAVLAEGEDGDIFFQLALVNIGLNDLSAARQYLEKASNAGRVLDRGDYFNLGERYEALGSANDQAIEAFRNCLGLQQDNVEAWQKLSGLYSLSGRDADAAECYVNLFQIDNNQYKDYLFKAGTIYENGGYVENAKDVYELYIGRRFDNPEVKVRLAKIEMRTGNCPKAIILVDDMDTTGPFGQDIIQINAQCKKQVRRIDPSITTNKSWKAMFFWRMSSGVILLGGGAFGYLMDQQAAKKLKEYQDYDLLNKEVKIPQKVADVKALHDEVEKSRKMRDLSYAAAGIGGVSLTLSFVIPNIFK